MKDLRTMRDTVAQGPGPLAVALVLAVVFFLGGGAAVAQDDHGNIPFAKLEAIYGLIMSPGCDYQYTLINCPSVQADEIKELVKSKLLLGESTENILQYLVDLYGPRILAAPQKKGFTLLAWWVPYFAIADGALIIAITIIVWKRRHRSGREEETPQEGAGETEDYGERIEEELQQLDL